MLKKREIILREKFHRTTYNKPEKLYILRGKRTIWKPYTTHKVPCYSEVQFIDKINALKVSCLFFMFTTHSRSSIKRSFHNLP